MTTARQRLSIHVPKSTQNRSCVLCGPCYNWFVCYTTVLTTEEVFFMSPAPCRMLGNGAVNTHPNRRVFSMSFVPWLYNEVPRITEGSSTVTLRVVGGDERGSLKSETVKYGRKSQGARTRERLRWQGPAAHKKTDPSSRQRGRPTKTRS
jgi:hypothetical protein